MQKSFPLSLKEFITKAQSISLQRDAYFQVAEILSKSSTALQTNDLQNNALLEMDAQLTEGMKPKKVHEVLLLFVTRQCLLGCACFCCGLLVAAVALVLILVKIEQMSKLVALVSQSVDSSSIIDIQHIIVVFWFLL